MWQDFFYTIKDVCAVSPQRRDMNALMYDVDNLRQYCGPGGRVLVFCFARAPGIFLKRLLEVSAGKDCSNICIIALPFGDNISRAGGRSEIEAHYKRTGEQVRH